MVFDNNLINKPVFFSIILLLFILSGSFAFSQEPACLYFFYGDGCQHCAKVEPIIRNLETQSEYPVTVHYFEIYNNRSNLLLLNQYFDDYNVPENMRGVPTVFTATRYLSGDQTIIEQVDSVARLDESKKCPSLQSTLITDKNENDSTEKIGSLSLLTIIGAAIVDSINPCAIAVLLILLGALLASGDKKRALKAGLAFTLSIYLAYFLFGLGLFSVIQISGLSYLFYQLIGLLAIIIGLANLKDYFWYGGAGFVMEIPRSWRPTLKKMLGSVTSPIGAFIMGFAVCLFELPCTGGPYFFVLSLLAEKTTMVGAIPILLLYNLFFVLPLILITLGLYFEFASIEKANEWKDQNIRNLHLVAGIIMVLLGAAVFFKLI